MHVQCPICLSRKAEENVYKLSACGHAFCFSCLRQSVQSRSTALSCAICREPWALKDIATSSRVCTSCDLPRAPGGSPQPCAIL